jgi:hypothetical protein
MTIGAFDALRDGVGRVRRAPALAVSVWLVMLAVAVPATLLMRAAIARHLGGSLAADAAADGVNYDWMVEFNQQADAGVGPLEPGVIGFAAVLDTASAFLDREPRALVVVPYQALLDRVEAIEGIQRGLADVKAGRTKPAQQVFDRLRRKHGIPR